MAEKAQKRWVCCLGNACSRLSAEMEPVLVAHGGDWDGVLPLALGLNAP